MQLMTFKQALQQALDEELLRDESIILMGEDLGSYGGESGVEDGLEEKYGKNRILSTPNSESALAGAATGAAVSGLRPVVEMPSADMTMFATDSLINQAAKLNYLSNGKLNVPLTVRIPTGSKEKSGAGASQNFEALFSTIPGLKVVSPTTPAQAKGLLKSAVRDNNPVLFIENRELYDTSGPVPEEEDFTIPLSSSVIEREGNDVTVVAWGPALLELSEVLNILEREGISVEIINPLTLYPMDMQPIYDSVTKTSRLVILHDGPKTGGIGAEIAANVIGSECFDYLDAPIIRVAGEDLPIGLVKSQKDQNSPKKEDILDAIYTVTGMK